MLLSELAIVLDYNIIKKLLPLYMYAIKNHKMLTYILKMAVSPVVCLLIDG